MGRHPQPGAAGWRAARWRPAEHASATLLDDAHVVWGSAATVAALATVAAAAAAAAALAVPATALAVTATAQPVHPRRREPSLSRLPMLCGAARMHRGGP